MRSTPPLVPAEVRPALKPEGGGDPNRKLRLEEGDADGRP